MTWRLPENIFPEVPDSDSAAPKTGGSLFPLCERIVPAYWGEQL